MFGIKLFNTIVTFLCGEHNCELPRAAISQTDFRVVFVRKAPQNTVPAEDEFIETDNDVGDAVILNGDPRAGYKGVTPNWMDKTAASAMLYVQVGSGLKVKDLPGQASVLTQLWRQLTQNTR